MGRRALWGQGFYPKKLLQEIRTFAAYSRLMAIFVGQAGSLRTSQGTPRAHFGCGSAALRNSPVSTGRQSVGTPQFF